MATKRFANMDGIGVTNSLRMVLKWRKERKRKMMLKDFSYTVPQAENVELAFLRTNRTLPTATWIGHCTFMLQIGGLNVLTDPVWTERMPFVQRLAPPGIAAAELPAIDLVLLSHGHYDHLDIPSLRSIQGNPLILAPEGMGPLLRRKGLDNVRELGWWTSLTLGQVRFTFVPAQHWHRRTAFDINTVHWGGWVLEDMGGSNGSEIESGRAAITIYFSGDSGYFRGFAEIGRRFRIDCALLPIGAYEPEWFMRIQHTTPEEAVQAYLDTGARMMIPMHYGAFKLADDTPKEALDRLHGEWERRKLPDDRLACLKHGETVRL